MRDTLRREQDRHIERGRESDIVKVRRDTHIEKHIDRERHIEEREKERHALRELEGEIDT